MRAEAFVLPDPFARPRVQFRMCAATGPDSGDSARGLFANSAASVSARSHNAKRRTSGALFAKRAAPDAPNTSSLAPDQTREKPAPARVNAAVAASRFEPTKSW